jgi:hypothetical protein
MKVMVLGFGFWPSPMFSPTAAKLKIAENHKPIVHYLITD